MNFEERIRDAQNHVRPFFLRLTNDPFLADDAIQFATVQCWRRWEDRDYLELIRLMVTVGRRFYYNQREKERNQKKRLANLDRVSNLLTNPESGPIDEMCDRVRESLHRLPVRWGDVLYRVFYNGQTNVEVAMDLRTPLSTVKTWRRRGLERLRLILCAVKN